MKYNGFVNMISEGREVLYEFKDGFFDRDGLHAKYRLSDGNFTSGYGLFSYKESNESTWFISELRFTF